MHSHQLVVSIGKPAVLGHLVVQQSQHSASSLASRFDRVEVLIGVRHPRKIGRTLFPIGFFGFT